MLEQLRVYWDKGTNNEADYFTKHHPTIHCRQIQPWYIYNSNLVRTIPQTIRLCEDVLNQVPGSQSRANFLKIIRSEPQYMTGKYHTFRQLKLPRQHIMHLTNLSILFNETNYSK